MLISKERNSEKVSPKQNGARQRSTYVKILMGSGAYALIIHVSYVNKNNLILRKKLHKSMVHNDWIFLFVTQG